MHLKSHRAGIGAWAPMLALLLVFVDESRAQPATAAAPALLDTTIVAGEADAQPPVKRGLAKYNEFDFGFTTFRIGYGFLVDFASYIQDDASKQQVVVESPDMGLRDFRFIFKGKFKTERPLSWTMGIMYDGGTKDWHFRQTGLMVDIPEIYSHVFVGRTKEGYSQYKYMVGYDIWTIERSPFLDAFVPIMAELALNYSYADFDGGGLRGGKYWRISPIVKYHLMDCMRVELGYG